MFFSLVLDCVWKYLLLVFLVILCRVGLLRLSFGLKLNRLGMLFCCGLVLMLMV